MKMKKIILGENKGVEYYPEDDTLLLIRCPKCEQENYAPNVAYGICTWCGYNARELLRSTSRKIEERKELN